MANHTKACLAPQGTQFAFTLRKNGNQEQMQKSLFIRNGKVVSDGKPGDTIVEYQGVRPDKVICIKTSTSVLYFCDERDAYLHMQKSDVVRVNLLPVPL